MYVLIFIFLLTQSFFGSIPTPEVLFANGYGLPNNLTIQCVNIINGNVSGGESPELESLKNKTRKAQVKNGCLNEKFNQSNNVSVFNLNALGININYTSIIPDSISSINTSDSSESDNEDKKRKTKKDTSAAVFGAGAAVMGLIGLGAYAWDYCRFKKHPKKGCDYSLFQDGSIFNGAWYDTHQASLWNASTIVYWPDFSFGGQVMQVHFPHFYSDGMIGCFQDAVFLYGRDFTSFYNALAEKFYMKKVNSNGQCLQDFTLPSKPKKIIYSNGSFVMLSYDGYVYFKTESSDTFERLYIKTSLNYFFEETVIDIVSSGNYLVLWTNAGQLIKVLMDPNNDYPVQLSTVTEIPMSQRNEYRIVDFQDGSFSLAKSDFKAVLSQKDYSVNYFTVMDCNKCNFYTPGNEKIMYLKDDISFLKKLLYEGYRFIVNRPFKCMSIFCFGFSLFLYMKYLKKR